MHVRKAEVEDSAGMARVQVDSYRTAYAGIMPQDYLDHFTYEEQAQDWRDFLREYYAASARYRCGEWDVEFPAGTFRPPLIEVYATVPV